jgi:hypothetical protein
MTPKIIQVPNLVTITIYPDDEWMGGDKEFKRQMFEKEGREPNEMEWAVFHRDVFEIMRLKHEKGTI